MEEELKQANENIKILVSEVVKLRKERDRSYCVHPQEKYDNEDYCEGNCDECKKKFYKGMEDYLLKEYQVMYK